MNQEDGLAIAMIICFLIVPIVSDIIANLTKKK